jgi:hypothetical protein
VEDEHHRIAAVNAVQLVIYHGRVVWIAFGALLAANSFFITFAGAIMTLFPVYSAAARIVGIFGSAICVAWILIIMRQSDYLRYYYACLRHLECQALPDGFQFAFMGLSLSDGQTVRHQALFPAGFRLRWGSRLFKVEWLMYFVICVFLFLYLAVVFAPHPLALNPALRHQ